jgi:serine/threonine protein kinase
MGLVFRAEDTRDGRIVALKLMRSRFTEDSTAVRRFQLEARLVAGLDHPNVCQVLAVGATERGELYLAMPLYEGTPLGERLRRGPLPVPDALEIAAQVARGLAAAHAQGIVHRDIKPSNILLGDTGTVTVLDFGIAKLAGVTLTGSLAGPLGTLAYMSPEQLRGDRVDARTDVWSLGVVLYEMLAGRRPWGRGAVGVVVNAIVHGDIEPVTRHRSDVPGAVVTVLAMALARSPEDRYPTASALEADLNAILDGRPHAGP